MASWNLNNIGSGNGLVPDGTKPSPEPMLIFHYWIPERYFAGNAQGPWIQIENCIFLIWPPHPSGSDGLKTWEKALPWVCCHRNLAQWDCLCKCHIDSVMATTSNFVFRKWHPSNLSSSGRATSTETNYGIWSTSYHHIENWMKWLSFCRWHFLDRKFVHFDLNLTEVCSQGNYLQSHKRDV